MTQVDGQAALGWLWQRWQAAAEPSGGGSSEAHPVRLGSRVEAEEAVHLGEALKAARWLCCSALGSAKQLECAFLLGSQLILCSTACLLGLGSPPLGASSCHANAEWASGGRSHSGPPALQPIMFDTLQTEQT